LHKKQMPKQMPSHVGLFQKLKKRTKATNEAIKKTRSGGAKKKSATRKKK